MSDRNVEAQPGDNLKSHTDRQQLGHPSVQSDDGHSCPDCGFERDPGSMYCENCGAAFAEGFAATAVAATMPHKADVAGSNQATRIRPSSGTAKPGRKPLALPWLRSRGSATAAKPRTPTVPAPELRRRSTTKAARPGSSLPRVSSPHPLSRRRATAPRQFRVPNLTGQLARLLSYVRQRGKRAIVGAAGVTGIVAIVSALLVTLPNHPVAPTPTGSVYIINWNRPVTLPVTSLDFGPYFDTLDNTLLMVGTVNATSTVGSATSVSSTTTVWASSDGATWTQRSDSGSFSVEGRRFVAQGISDDGQGGLVVIGNSLGQAPTDVAAAAWHSTDGAAWTQMQVDSGKGQEMAAGVAAGNGVAVAAGNGVAWLSTDGLSWSPQALPGAAAPGGSYAPRVVASFKGGFVIVGLWIGSGPTRSTAWYSSTGRDWTQSATSLAGFLASGAASINGRVVVVGSDLGDTSPGLAASWSTTDGNTWTESTAPTDLSTVALDGVARVGSSLVAFGSPSGPSSTAQQAGPVTSGSTPKPAATELIWVTDDGANWLPISSNAVPIDHASMGAVGDNVVMVGGAGKTFRAFGGTLTLGKLRPAVNPTAALKFALTIKAGALPMIPDVVKGFSLGPVTSSAGRFYTFATGPTGTSIYNSGDGGLWVQELKPAGLTKITTSGQAILTGRAIVLKAISDGKGGILAAGKITNSDGDNGMIWHMTKAGTWKQVNFQDDTPTEFASIAVGPSGFVAASDTVGGSQVMYSTDGDTWQAGTITIGGGLPLYVATYHYGFVAVGVDPTKGGATNAWTSPDGRTWTLRTDWHLPPNVTSVAGMGYGLVATAKTPIPGSSTSTASPSASAVPIATASGTAGPAASVTAKPTPTPKPKPTPKPTPSPTLPLTLKPITWWWSGTGVTWTKSGLTSSSDSWSIVGNQIVVLDAPTKLSSNWALWGSVDGRTWKQPESAAIVFPASKLYGVAFRGSSIIVVGWQSNGVLKDYFGTFSGGG
jgi:hypothetical protein